MSDKSYIPKRKQNAFLPIMGLILAVCIGVIAYFLAPIIIEFLHENADGFTARTASLSENTVKGMVAFTTWVIVFGIAMVFVAIVAGGDSVVDKEQKLTAPTKRSSKREIDRYNRIQEKQRQKKLKALKRLKAKQEVEERKKARQKQ